MGIIIIQIIFISWSHETEKALGQTYLHQHALATTLPFKSKKDRSIIARIIEYSVIAHGSENC